MKRLNSIALFLVITLTSCSTQKTETLWVSGYKTDCDMGAGMGKCLNIAKTKNLEDAKWENFYDTIEGFTFQEGYFQKVKVTKKELDPQKVPADASTLQYSLVKVLEKKEDFRNPLSGKWTLVAINNKAIVTTENIPELNFDIAKNRIYGTDGCNNYSAEIKNITSNDIQFGTISNTQKCVLI